MASDEAALDGSQLRYRSDRGRKDKPAYNYSRCNLGWRTAYGYVGKREEETRKDRN